MTKEEANEDAKMSSPTPPTEAATQPSSTPYSHIRHRHDYPVSRGPTGLRELKLVSAMRSSALPTPTPTPSPPAAMHTAAPISFRLSSHGEEGEGRMTVDPPQLKRRSLVLGRVVSTPEHERQGRMAVDPPQLKRRSFIGGRIVSGGVSPTASASGMGAGGDATKTTGEAKQEGKTEHRGVKDGEPNEGGKQGTWEGTGFMEAIVRTKIMEMKLKDSLDNLQAVAWECEKVLNGVEESSEGDSDEEWSEILKRLEKDR